MMHDPENGQTQRKLDQAYLEIGRYKRLAWKLALLEIVVFVVTTSIEAYGALHIRHRFALREQSENTLLQTLNTERTELARVRRELREERRRASELSETINTYHSLIAQIRWRWSEVHHPVDPRAEARRRQAPYFEYIDTRTGRRLPLVTEVTEAQRAIRTRLIDDDPMGCRRIEYMGYALDFHFGLRVWLPDGTLCPQSTPLQNPAPHRR